MILKQKSNTPFLRFRVFEPYKDILWHGVFTRKGGVSRKPFDSLNASFSGGDEPQAVKRNRELIRETAGAGELLFTKQVHGADVLIYDGAAPVPAGEIRTADAIVTRLPGKFPVIMTADCQAVLLFDPVKRAVANVHSGWRSSLKNIAGNAVRAMETRFNCNPSDMLAGIGPSLGPCCGEFKNYRREFDKDVFRYKQGDCNFDFWKMTDDQLVRAGLCKKNIESSGICTKCNTSDFFSYRKEKVTGRFATVIGLKCEDRN